jgi:trans-aconitate 2-methyltransferase
VTPASWDPEQYLRYAGQRERAFWDLVTQIPHIAPREVADLGCGPGTATEGLLSRWPEARVLGIDNSPEMIERATARAAPPRLTFELADISSWKPAPQSLDVVVSNAALQWIPQHVDLFPGLLAALRPRGALAFQVPGQSRAPSHTLLSRLAASPTWRDKLGNAPVAVEPPTPLAYHERLRDLGAGVDMWETTYYHQLTGPDPVLQWVRATALRPYLAALAPQDAEAFTQSYAAALLEAYPPEANGQTLFPFRRVFVVATLP